MITLNRRMHHLQSVALVSLFCFTWSSCANSMQEESREKSVVVKKEENNNREEMIEYLNKNRELFRSSSESKVVPLNVPTYPYRGDVISVDTEGRKVLLESN